jgi:hypothetical protein
MSYHLRVLQSLVRLSHSSSAPSRAALLARAGGTDSALGDALDLLVTLGLIQSSDPHESQQPLRLTLSGLAVGTAYAAEAARQRDEAKAVEEPTRATTRTTRMGSVRKSPRDRRATSRSVANRAA